MSAPSVTLYRGEEKAIVEAGSATEASFKAIGFAEAEAEEEAIEADEEAGSETVSAKSKAKPKRKGK